MYKCVVGCTLHDMHRKIVYPTSFVQTERQREIEIEIGGRMIEIENRERWREGQGEGDMERWREMEHDTKGDKDRAA